MINKPKDLKKIYDDIEVPKDLDQFVESALKSGRDKMSKNKKKRIWITSIGSVAILAIIFTTTINTIPSFADSLISIPGVGELVKILKFTDGKAQGGESTDGADARSISLKKSGKNEIITLRFMDNNNGEARETVPHYAIKYMDNPATMTFVISGARKMNAEKDFQYLKDSDYISDVYRTVILDDSAVKFTIVFKSPIKYEVKEYNKPAQIQVTLMKGQKANTNKVYSVRTPSYESGEGLGIVEETVCNESNVRVLKDKEGTFCVEMGNFDTKEEAENMVNELNKKYGEHLKLIIEERGANSIPEKR